MNSSQVPPFNLDIVAITEISQKSSENFIKNISMEYDIYSTGSILVEVELQFMSIKILICLREMTLTLLMMNMSLSGLR